MPGVVTAGGQRGVGGRIGACAILATMTTEPVFSDATRTRLARCSSATLATQLFKRGLRNQVMQGVLRLTPKAAPLVGEAFTLEHSRARGH